MITGPTTKLQSRAVQSDVPPKKPRQKETKGEAKMALDYDQQVLERLAHDKAVARAMASQKKDLGTKATRKRRLSCPLRTLLERKRIDSGLYRAGLELERVVRLLLGELGYSISKYEPKRDRSWSVADETVQRQLLLMAYDAWREAVSDRTRKLTFALLFENIPARTIERQLRIKNGQALDYLIDALEAFHKQRTLVERRVVHIGQQRAKRG